MTGDFAGISCHMPKFALLFLLVYASGIVSAVLFGPVWGFYLYELVYFLNPANRWWGNSIPEISYSFYVVAVMLGMFLLRFPEHQNRLRDMPEAKWFAVILLCYGIVTIISVNPEMHNRWMVFLLKTYVVIYVAYRMIDSEEKLELALIFFMVGAAYIGYESMMVGRDEFGRVEGIGTVDSPNANTIAASVVPVIPLIMYFGWHGSIRLKLLAALCAAFVVNALVLINSRGAFLGAAVAFGFFLAAMMFSRFKLPRQRIFVVLIIIASIALAIRLVDDVFVERLATIETQSSPDSEGSGGRRINFWLATFDLLRDHPFGSGIFGYETLSPIYLDPELLGVAYGRSARAVHSLWFQGLSEIGWLGFSAFLALLLSLYRHSRKAKKLLALEGKFRQYYLLTALQAGMAGFLTAGSFINMFRSEILYWMLLFGISCCVISLRKYGDTPVKDGEKVR